MLEIHDINKALSTILRDDNVATVASMPDQSLVTLQDYTLLNAKADNATLAHFVKTADLCPKLAGICVYPHHLHQVKHHPAKKVTVINFPKGTDSLTAVCADLASIIKVTNVNEVDYVFPHSVFAQGYQSFALSQCQKVIDMTKKAQLTIKVIMETGALASPHSIFEMSQAILKLKPDFIKTSTGVDFPGAKLTDTYIICQSIVESGVDCGIKVSGGIGDVETAKQHVKIAESVLQKKAKPDWFRIGASKLLK